MSHAFRPVAVLAALALAACAPAPSPEPPDLSGEAAAAVRAEVDAWAAQAAAKDADGFVSKDADDAVVMFEQAPDLNGIAAIREALPAMMQDPAFSLSFGATDVVASRSGDLAYETGRYEMTVPGPDGSPVPSNGHYVAVWRKQADGTWKCVVDAPLSDPPAPAEEPAGS